MKKLLIIIAALFVVYGCNPPEKAKVLDPDLVEHFAEQRAHIAEVRAEVAASPDGFIKDYYLEGIELIELLPDSEYTYENVMTVNQIIDNMADWEDSTIMVTGMVHHVCKHGGARVVIMDVDSTRIHVESSEQIPAYDATLENAEVLIIANVLWDKIDEAYLTDWESRIDQQESEALAELDDDEEDDGEDDDDDEDEEDGDEDDEEDMDDEE